MLFRTRWGDRHLRVGYTPHQHKIKTIQGERFRVHVGGALYNRLARHERICHGRQEGSLHLGLLRVCRQVYGEAALLPYAMNVFTFENEWVMRKCLKRLRPTQKRAMAGVFCLGERFWKIVLEIEREWMWRAGSGVSFEKGLVGLS